MSAYKGGTTYSANEDAAQSFLNDKLSKNKFNSSNNYSDYSTEGFDPSSYTSDQLSALNASGGPKKFGAGSYDVVTNQDEIDAAGGGSVGDNRGFDADSDSGRNYASGAWGSGDLDAAALASKYNLDTSQEGRGDGHIWGRNADGSEVYIGKSSMDLASNEELISNHSKQAGDEVDHSGVPESLSSSGDIKGAILTEWNGGPAAKEAPEPIMGKEEIVHSPEIQQAKERVGKYENDVLSGKTSQQIYGGADAFENSYQLNLQDVPSVMTNNNYQFNAGDTDFSGSDVSPEAKTPAPQQAASSFLENQKKKTIKQANIQPVG